MSFSGQLDHTAKSVITRKNTESSSMFKVRTWNISAIKTNKIINPDTVVDLHTATYQRVQWHDYQPITQLPKTIKMDNPEPHSAQLLLHITKYPVDIWKREVVIIQRQGIILIEAEV